MREWLTGYLLALQFFTVLPIHKSFDMTRTSATSMYSAIPFIGLLMGAVMMGFLQLNEQFFHLSVVFTAVIMVVLHFTMTGGLHMDGVVDTGDAYFSYRDRAKRLEILDDPRVGAFGAMTLVIFVLLKLGLFYELLMRDVPLLLFILLPYIARQSGIIVFLTTHPSKEKGIVSYFKKTVDNRLLGGWVVLYVVVLIGIGFVLPIVWSLVIAMLLFTWLYRAWTIRNFGGISGDLIGASFEGAELFLWFVVLCIL